jgi:hypothetical protein
MGKEGISVTSILTILQGLLIDRAIGLTCRIITRNYWNVVNLQRARVLLPDEALNRKILRDITILNASERDATVPLRTAIIRQSEG